MVPANSHKQNLQKLEEVFKRFRKHKSSECQFGDAKITYLGYDICTERGISPGEAKTEVNRNWPAPNSIKGIRGLIKLTSFFRRAIKDFISADLNKLIRKNSGYTHGPLPPKALESFNRLKEALISKPCLSSVHFNKRFYVTCDASATHYGSCLSQIGDGGIEQPCGYASKLLSEKEAKQQPGIRERVSILFSFRHWHPYLVGKEFTCRMDHKPNLSLFQGKTKVYDSMSDEIMSYLPFKLEYLNSKDMFVDVLSRPRGYINNINAIPVYKSYTPALLKHAHDDPVTKIRQLHWTHYVRISPGQIWIKKWRHMYDHVWPAKEIIQPVQANPTHISWHISWWNILANSGIYQPEEASRDRTCLRCSWPPAHPIDLAFEE